MTRRPVPPPGWIPPGRASGGSIGLVDAAGAREGDRAAVAAGDTWQGLMRRAAGHLSRTVVEVGGGGYGLRVAVVVGKGDNGGDGWTVAPLLRQAGAQVTVVAVLGSDGEASEATAAARSAWLGGGGRTTVGTADLPALLDRTDVVVDCLLGTGSSGTPRGAVGEAVAAVVAARDRNPELLVVACDLPTGVDSDTGAVAGAVVTADVTVTFGAVKRGMVLHPGASHVGRLVVASLGPRYRVRTDGWLSLTGAGARPPARDVDAEKRKRGVALVVAGSVGSVGAAALCTDGLLRGGAGLVTAAVPESIRDVLAGVVPAAMTRPLPDDGTAVTGDAVGALDDVEVFDVVVAGPGLTPGAGTRATVEHLLRRARRLVLDADALNVFRDSPDTLARHDGDLVLTPHVRELARLSARPVETVDRAREAVALANRWRATVVAKGPGTIVAAPDGRVWVTPVGSPALATGGTGDVLAGLVAAAVGVAQDVPLAVARAVWQHAFAGWLLGRQRADHLTADVLVHHLPAVLAALGALADERPAWPFDGGPSPDLEAIQLAAVTSTGIMAAPVSADDLDPTHLDPTDQQDDL